MYGYGWWSATTIEGSCAQILDLEVAGDRFYGVGSTISQPPYFFYEVESGMGDSFSFEAVRLVDEGLSSFDGEVWDIAIDSAGDFLLAGVNQGVDTGVLWYNTSDNPYSTSDWTLVSVADTIPVDGNNATRFYGACRAGDTMVAVGDYSQKEMVWLPTPQMAGPIGILPRHRSRRIGVLSKCQIVDGLVYIVGADGLAN